jgi:hypothetical protein
VLEEVAAVLTTKALLATIQYLALLPQTVVEVAQETQPLQIKLVETEDLAAVEGLLYLQSQVA